MKRQRAVCNVSFPACVCRVGLALAAWLFAASVSGQQQITYVRVTPEGLSSTSSASTFRLLSPDGTKVVFNQTGADGKSHVYCVPADGSEYPTHIGVGEDFDTQSPAVFWVDSDASVLGIDYELNPGGPFTYDTVGGGRSYLCGPGHEGTTESDGWTFWGYGTSYFLSGPSRTGPPLTEDGFYAFDLSARKWGWESYVKDGQEYWRPTVNVEGKTLLWRAHFTAPDQDPDAIVFGDEQTGFDTDSETVLFSIAGDGSSAVVLSGQHEIESGYYDDFGQPFKKVVSDAYVCRPGTTTQLSLNANYWGGATVSGDGQWVAYTEDTTVDSHWLNNEVVVSKLDGSQKQVVYTPTEGGLDLWGMVDPEFPEESVFWVGTVRVVDMNADGSRVLFEFEDGPMQLYVADRGRGLTDTDWGLYRIRAPGFSSAAFGIGISNDGTKVAFLQFGDPNADPETSSSKLYIYVATIPLHRQAGEPVFRVDHLGVVTAKAYATARADFAEHLPAAPGVSLEPGDVLALAPDGSGVVRAARSDASGVIGVVSTAPGILGGVSQQKNRRGTASVRVPVAIVGIVPVKVTAADGPIRPGALLGLSRSVPGRLGVLSPISFGGRMFVPEQAVVGKALEALQEGEGTLRVRLVGH
ncbi:MAG: hypothetical protein GXP31_00385 [Kiritimatiellaeota bacterium]|nr:hypothetical protein [Kiritimatiellota bacterium]